MDSFFLTTGILASVYTLVEIGGLLLRAEPPVRRRVRRTCDFRRDDTDFSAAVFHTAEGGIFTIDLEPIPGRQANYYG